MHSRGIQTAVQSYAYDRRASTRLLRWNRPPDWPLPEEGEDGETNLEGKHRGNRERIDHRGDACNARPLLKLPVARGGSENARFQRI